MRKHKTLLSIAAPLALYWSAGHILAQGERAPHHERREQPQAAAQLNEFLETLWPLANEKGIARPLFDAALADLEPDPSVIAAAEKQAEFERPLKAYLAEAVSARRIARGRATLHAHKAELAEISNRYGVPAPVIVAAFGLESDYGSATGGKNIIRSLATLAFVRRDRPEFRAELVDALWVMQKSGLSRAALKGSWAGAMGGPQFLPSAYLRYAVSYRRDGPPDIWTKPLDILASIANFLRQSGWQPGLPWGLEVILPDDFSFASLHQSFAAFEAQGVKAANGESFPQGDATVFLPSGARGPAFLLSANYWVLKAYNNSDSYALSLALLADRIEGKGALHGHWPENELFLPRAEKSEIQRLLAALGLYRGTIDGRFGQASRDAIHDFQIRTGVFPADGFAAPGLLNRLNDEVRRNAGQ